MTDAVGIAPLSDADRLCSLPLPDMTPTSKHDLVRASYRKRRKAGVCVRCGAPAVNGLTQCENHRQARAAYLRKRYREMSHALKASRSP